MLLPLLLACVLCITSCGEALIHKRGITYDKASNCILDSVEVTMMVGRDTIKYATMHSDKCGTFDVSAITGYNLFGPKITLHFFKAGYNPMSVIAKGDTENVFLTRL